MAEQTIRPRNFTDAATDSDLQNADNYIWLDTDDKAKKMPITKLAVVGDTAATEADLVAGSTLPIMTDNGPKALPGNTIAKASEQAALKETVSEILVPSINLFNVDSVYNSIDKYVNSDGTLVDNSNYNSSGYIPVTSGKTYSFSAGARSVCFYNGTNYVAWSENVSTITVPSGANALRFCATKARWNNNYMMVDGSSLPDYYVKGGDVIDINRIPPTNIPKKYVSIEQISFSEPSINLFNISDPNVALGKYLNNGTLTNNSNYNSSGYINVTAGETYTFSAQARYVEYYNGTSYVSNEQYKTSVTIPNNCNALRFSTAIGNWSGYMVVHGDELPANYVPFGQVLSESVIPKKDTYLQDIVGGKAAITSMGGAAKISTYTSVSSGDTIQLTDVPKDPKNGLFFSCGFKFSVFTSLKIGKGYNAYRGAWIEVDGTNIVCKTYEQSVTTIGTVAHGLVLSSFMRLSVTTDKRSKWNVTLNSEGGTFTTSFQLAFEFCGTAFASFGSAATSVKLAFGDSTYKYPVWLFGDSYVGISNPARWPYYLNEQGYLNIMMDGLAGRGSPAALADFERALAFGSPKYVIWCMGMNDTDSVWLNNYKQVRRLCEQNGIELILTTIPTTPTHNKETITEYVRNSGLRYIDFYAAVGTNSNGEWYSGMLSSDNVHPTPLGAKALASQVLVDFPEIVQFFFNESGLASYVAEMKAKVDTIESAIPSGTSSENQLINRSEMGASLDERTTSDSVTKEYDPDEGVGEGGYCMNEGQLYQANEMMSGDFDATKCTKKELYEVLMQQIEQQKLMLSAIESQQTNLERPEGYIPDVGDAVWVGDDGKKHFYKGDTVNASALTSAGLTFVGVVSLKRGNKVWVLKKSYSNNIRFASCWAWEITGVAYNESNTIQFQQRGLTAAGATTYTNYKVGDPFTFTPTDIDDAVSKIDAFLRANQGGKSYDSLIVCNYNWHCAKIDGRIWVISDFGESSSGDDAPSYRQYESQVVSTAESGSISSKTNMWSLAGFDENNSILQRVDGKIGGSTLWNVYRAKQYMASNGNIGTPDDTVPTGSNGIYSEANFTAANCPNTYALYGGDYTNYLEHMLMMYPATAGAVKYSAGTAKAVCDAMEAVTYVPLSGGAAVNMFTAVHVVKTMKAHPTASVSGMDAGDWYVPGFDESFEILRQMKVDGTDVINKAFERSNNFVLSLSVTRCIPARYGASSSWLLFHDGRFHSNSFNYTSGIVAVALLEF